MADLRHIAIIMDGNGRWASQRGRPRAYGHIQGVRVAKKIITHSSHIGLSHLTLYAFSSENWSRPHDEVSMLMKLLKRYLVREKNNLNSLKIRFQVIGQLERLPKEIIFDIQNLIKETSHNTGMTLTLALSYSGRSEILEAAKKLVVSIQEDPSKKLSDINEERFSQYLDSQHLPDPDLIIRTSGEKRVSNFFLWQLAYSEFYFFEKHWPDFTSDDLDTAIKDYFLRQRRYGKTSDQISAENSPSGSLIK